MEKTYLIYLTQGQNMPPYIVRITCDEVQPPFNFGPDSMIGFLRNKEIVAQFVVINISGWVLWSEVKDGDHP